jgi:hypothetical protein
MYYIYGAFIVLRNLMESKFKTRKTADRKWLRGGEMRWMEGVPKTGGLVSKTSFGDAKMGFEFEGRKCLVTWRGPEIQLVAGVMVLPFGKSVREPGANKVD